MASYVLMYGVAMALSPGPTFTITTMAVAYGAKAAWYLAKSALGLVTWRGHGQRRNLDEITPLNPDRTPPRDE